MNHEKTTSEKLTRLIGRTLRALERTDLQAANGAFANARVAADHGRGHERLPDDRGSFV